MNAKILTVFCTLSLSVAGLVVGGAVQEAPKAAQDVPPVADVKQSIQRAIEYLRQMQQERGHWVFERDVTEPGKSTPKVQEDPAFNLGLTALAALALIENAVPPSDPTIQKAYQYIREEAPSNKRTYNLGLSILFLSRLGSREDRPLIQRMARRLILGQLDSGGWSYECPIDQDRETSRTGLQSITRKSGIGDNSNTQFAVLGLWAAARAGVPVDDPLELVAKRFRGSQAPTGGWDYQSTGKGDSNAMTTAGVYALTVAVANATRKSATSSASGTKSTTKGTEPAAASSTTAKITLAEDPTFKRGLVRVEQFADQIASGTSPYFLWSVERLGVTLQLPTFGTVDWYAKGKKALLESQKSSGAWEVAWKGPADTSFALLFLRKANLGRDISYALTGDASKPFVLLDPEKPQAFAKLSEAVAAAADGAVIEIMGHGPFEMAGLTCTGKSLTIRPGEGFEPVLIHKLELLQDPDRDPKLRYLIGVESGKLSLEGVRLQIDPETRRKVPWTLLAVQAAELRAANCNFTNSNTAAVSGVELSGAARLNLTNCLMAGFSPAIDAIVSGEQQLELENCLVYSRLGFQSRSPNSPQTFGVSSSLTRTTFHVGEVINATALRGSASFNAEANIFHTSVFSSGLRPASVAAAARHWEGRRNLFDLTRWLSSGSQPVREVRDMESWRKYWKTDEEGSFMRSAPFAVSHQLGPFRHTTNPNDWRLTVERLSSDINEHVQIGCDSYLVGAGQPYFQFKESLAYNQWQQGKQAPPGTETEK